MWAKVLGLLQGSEHLVRRPKTSGKAAQLELNRPTHSLKGGAFNLTSALATRSNRKNQPLWKPKSPDPASRVPQTPPLTCTGESEEEP